MTRWHDCRLADIIGNPVMGPSEIKFAQGVVVQQANVAHSEIGDTLDPSDDMKRRAEISAEISGVFIRRELISGAVIDCLANRYLGNCSFDSCAGSQVAAEFINDVVTGVELKSA
ncbi:MAG: hypothetical protein AAB624_01650 [Patescibacteria group bacterium]